MSRYKRVLLSKSTSIRYVYHEIDTNWVGTISMGAEAWDFTPQDQGEITALLAPMHCTPLFVPPDIIKGSYLGYCKQILWPVSVAFEG